MIDDRRTKGMEETEEKGISNKAEGKRNDEAIMRSCGKMIQNA
jgi:hypothetical protein